MREILFRAKATNRDKGFHRTKYKNGDWVYGLVTCPFDEKFPSLPAEMRNTDGVEGIEVDYKTIGQYTGLTDKNGNKIFEGDVVLYDDEEFGEIVWDEQTARFEIDGDGVIYDFDNFCGRELEVVGSRWDNPELLNEDNNNE